jgi:hypothetical protein
LRIIIALFQLAEFFDWLKRRRRDDAYTRLRKDAYRAAIFSTASVLLFAGVAAVLGTALENLGRAQPFAALTQQFGSWGPWVCAVAMSGLLWWLLASYWRLYRVHTRPDLVQ